jgi:hypothetical protein
MYEMWLAINIVYEIALNLWPALLPLLLVWLVLLLINRQRLDQVAWTTLLAVAVSVGVAALLALPSLSKSSLTEMGYWVDWASILAMAAGLGVAAAAWLWPALAMQRNR